MQEYDVIKVETEYMRNLLGRVLHDVLQKKKGYCVDFQICALSAANYDGEIELHVELDAVTDTKELKKICKSLGIFGELLPLGLKLLSNGFAQKNRYHLIENMVEKWLKENFKIKIRNLQFYEEKKKAYASLKADAKMEEKDIKKILKKHGFI